MLNRIIRFTSNGIEYEGDIRHSEIIVKQLGLEDARSLSTPGGEEPQGNGEDDLLNDEYATAYKSITARANYLASDRPDIQYTVKGLASKMSKPTQND